jgi:hypothetical protein
VSRAVVIGQSHVHAIAQALNGAAGGDQGISVYRIGDGPMPSACNLIGSMGDATALVAKLPADTPVFLSILGAYHNILGLLRAGDDFDFLLDERDGVDSDVPVHIPHRAVASAFGRQLTTANKIRRLRDSAKSPVHLLSTPPPKRSNEFMMERFLRSNKSVYRGRSIEEAGIERPEVRLKLWKLESRLIQDWARAEGMAFVPAPPQSFDKAGYLREEFYFDDATHANAAYGSLVVDQIKRLAEAGAKHG